MHQLSYLWETCKALSRDLKNAERVCQISLTSSENGLFVARAQFFSMKRRARFHVNFAFCVMKGWLLFPSGKVSATLNVEYGNIDTETMLGVQLEGSDMITRWCGAINSRLQA